MDVKQNEKAMMEWFDKHKDRLLGTTGFKKRRYVPSPVVTKKMPKNIHYGDEYNSKATLVKSWKIHGHTISLWSDGNLTCDCNGWVFKRNGIQRECVHVREKYAELTDNDIPDKSTPKKSKLNRTKIDELVDRIEAVLVG